MQKQKQEQRQKQRHGKPKRLKNKRAQMVKKTYYIPVTHSHTTHHNTTQTDMKQVGNGISMLTRSHTHTRNTPWHYMWMHTSKSTYIHTYIHTYVRTYIHTYIHTYVHTYIRTYIHTYLHKGFIWKPSACHAFSTPQNSKNALVQWEKCISYLSEGLSMYVCTSPTYIHTYIHRRHPYIHE